jgi:hypothetical protein
VIYICQNNVELDSLSKENLQEIYNTIEEIEKGNMAIVKQEHQIKQMVFQKGNVPIGEIYNIEVIYTCKICKNRKNDIGICDFDNQFKDQICIRFERGDINAEN